jgi:hypothetical protein
MTIAPTSPPGRRTNPTGMVGVVVLAVLVLTGLVLIARPGWIDRTVGSGDVIEGSGRTVTETRDVAPFTSFDLAGANNVSITIGADQSVRVQADDNLIDLITTVVRGDELVISQRGAFVPHGPMNVAVIVPSLQAVTLSGSGILTVEAVQADTLAVALPGSGTTRASGTANRLQATLDGSGDMRLSDLTTAQATAVVSGSALIQLVATEALDASISGTGTILYGGNPIQVTKNITGTGTIIEH